MGEGRKEEEEGGNEGFLAHDFIERRIRGKRGSVRKEERKGVSSSVSFTPAPHQKSPPYLPFPRNILGVKVLKKNFAM